MKYKGLTPKQINKAVYGDRKDVNQVNKKNVDVRNKPKLVKRLVQKHNPSYLHNLTYHINKDHSEYPVPEWFYRNVKSKLSIIVPLYLHDLNQIIKFVSGNTSHRVEYIFVDNNCPSNSKETLITALERFKNKMPDKVGKMIFFSETCGTNHCLNTASEYASGDHLLFLNPDLWVDKILFEQVWDILKNKQVDAISGQILDRNHELIVESGLQWNWNEKRFMRIGSEIYQKFILTKPFRIDNCPNDLLSPNIVEGLNSDFMIIKKSLFNHLGKFSPNIKSQKWSNADFSLSMREKGYRIYTTPMVSALQINKQKLTPDKEHEQQGEAIFENNWISTGRLHTLAPESPQFNDRSVKSILVRRQAAHGDVLLASAVAPALKKKYPEAKITFSTDFPDVLIGNKYIDSVIGDEYKNANIVFNLDMCYEYRPNVNILQAYADHVGVSISDCHTDIATQETPILNDYIVMHAGKTNWVGRNWSTIKFDQISKRLKEQNIKIICVGSMKDHATAYCDLDLRGKLNVSQLAYVIKNSRLFVGIDSLPMHLAQCTGVDGVAFFGSINPSLRLINKHIVPIVAAGLPCLGCHHKQPIPCVSTTTCAINQQECINNVSVDYVWKHINKALNI